MSGKLSSGWAGIVCQRCACSNNYSFFVKICGRLSKGFGLSFLRVDRGMGRVNTTTHPRRIVKGEKRGNVG